jgi:hypothetical protein
LNIAGGDGKVSLMGVEIKKIQAQSGKISTTSDFLINADKEISVNRPLVLPCDVFTEPLVYINEPWVNTHKAPFFDSKSIENRILPYSGEKYPYLTISDFLEPVLIRVPSEIEKNDFFDGNFITNSECDFGFLLPIKPKYFEYFNSDQLNKTTNNGEKIFEFKKITSDNIEVYLRIPIGKNKHISFKRTYYQPKIDVVAPSYAETENKGAIFRNDFTLAITPFFKFPPNSNIEYNVAFYERDGNSLTENITYDLKFYSNFKSEKINILKVQKRFKSEEQFNMYSYKVEKDFDYIQVSNNFGNGIIIPKFKTPSRGQNKFTFAIDFGTSNTHIEYTINDDYPQPFEIYTNEKHLGKFIKDDRILNPKLDLDLFPNEISQETKYFFPHRTTLSFHNNINFDDPKFALGNANIPFYYERQDANEGSQNIVIKTNLKWDHANKDNKAMVELYFENLLKLIRNKIILNSGDISKTKIVWFYPSNMMTFQLKDLKDVWSYLIPKFLDSNVTVSNISESFAPFYNYKNLEGLVAESKPVVSIDIGGGTTDVVVFTENTPSMFTSFKFAGNAIFGDDYNRNINLNGFINKYSKQDKYSKKYNNSENTINYYFSRKNNFDLKTTSLNIDFLEDLKSDMDLKIVFVIFYEAIIYHIANLMKSKELTTPERLLFSGTASQLLKIIGHSKNSQELLYLTNLIFKKVFTNEDKIKEIILSSNPKEVSAKGGTKIDQIDIKPEDIKAVSIAGDNILMPDEGNIFYIDSNDHINSTLESYGKFLDSVNEINNSFSYYKNFGINPNIYNMSIEFLRENAENALRTGISIKKKELGDLINTEQISETFFFYPLIGSLGELAYKIVTRENN